MQPRRSGYTLLEIAIVLGGLAVLAGFLLVSLRGARESALQTICAGRLNAIGRAYLAYAGDFDGHMATCSAGGVVNSSNWLFWQTGRDVNQSALAPYLGLHGQALQDAFRCPATPIENQLGFQKGPPYPYTFSMNAFQAFYRGLTLQRVVNPSHKIVVYDENRNADDDVFWYLTPRDTIAGRHGSRSMQQVDINDAGTVSAMRALGNGLFFDGHVELVDNDTCHDPLWNDPTEPRPGPLPTTEP